MLIFPVRNRLFCFSLFLVITCGISCSPRKKETEQSSSAAARETSTKSQPKTSGQLTQIQDISDNPNFYSTKDISPQTNVTRDLDSVIRPVLKKLFGDAKLTKDNATPETKADGEMVTESLDYVVKRLIDSSDGKPLHQAFVDARFSRSPRLGSEPTVTNKWIMMSLFRRTNLRPYSLVIQINIAEQTLSVTSFQLGSRYDRLM